MNTGRKAGCMRLFELRDMLFVSKSVPFVTDVFRY